MNKDAYYFSHDSNSRNDVKILKLRRILGTQGYGLFWMIIEVLRESKDYKLPLTSLKELSFDFRESEELILSLIKDFELFTITDDYFFFSESLNRRMISLELKRQKLSEAGKRGRAKQLQIDLEPEIPALPGPPPGSKVKESKVKESKVEESKEIYSIDSDVNSAFIEYLQFRKQNKLPNTERVINRLIDKLHEFSKDKNEAIEVINKALTCKWKDFYPLKKNDNNQSNQPIITISKKYPDAETYKREGYDR